MLKYSTNQNTQKNDLSSLNLPYVLGLFDKCIHTFVYIWHEKRCQWKYIYTKKQHEHILSVLSKIKEYESKLTYLLK